MRVAYFQANFQMIISVKNVYVLFLKTPVFLR